MNMMDPMLLLRLYCAASLLETDLATENSVIRVLLIKSREAWQIARECHAAS
jgi:hypothetical protein